MSPEAEIPPAKIHPGKRWPISLAAYHLLTQARAVPKNTELIEGTIFYKVSKSPLHSTITRRLLQLLDENLFPGCFVQSEQPITCEATESEPEPDIAVIAGKIADYIQEHPKTADLVVEVCVTSHEYDLSKLPAYAAAGVRECWIIRADAEQIDVYRKPSGRAYLERTTHGPGGAITLEAFTSCALALDQIFLH